MTANAMDRDRQTCLDAGMNDHLAKPIDPDKLFDALLRWITPRAFPRDAAQSPVSTRVSLDPISGSDSSTISGMDTAAASEAHLVATSTVTSHSFADSQNPRRPR